MTEPDKNNTSSRSALVVDDGSDYADKENPGCWTNIKSFPKTVFAIFGNEFCERFSYYGMRAVLVLYLTSILHFNDSTAEALYHAFIVVCYTTPLFGSILADGYIGKYHTILWISIVYACGNVILAVAATRDENEALHPALDFVGLLIIGFGTGGIKPCVSAFGGDQFLGGKERFLNMFFSIFYFSINAGSVITTYITPIFRDTPCMGRDTCFPLAFGIPAGLMVIALIFFLLGTPWYIRIPPEENVVAEIIKVFKGACANRRFFSQVKRENFLDHYLDNHSCQWDSRCTKQHCQKAQFIKDIRAFLRVCVMYIPVPVFWALFDQQGSYWLLQAASMDGRITKGFILLPDQMSTINPILILIFIPIFQILIYPLVKKCGINPTPLRRMTCGGLLAAGSFVIAMFVQFGVNKTLPDPPPEGLIRLAFINTYPCNITITPKTEKLDVKVINIPALVDSSDFKSKNTWDKEFKPQGDQQKWEVSCPTLNLKEDVTTNAKKGEAAFYVLTDKSKVKDTFQANLKKPHEGKGYNLISLTFLGNARNLSFCKEGDCGANSAQKLTIPENNLTTNYFHLEHGSWNLYTTDDDKDTGVEFELGMGAIYSLTLTPLDKNTTTPRYAKTFYQMVGANEVPLLLQIPQYVVITAGEILFSITGLEFSYSQAPQSMKSVVQAVWLLTVAGGNLLDLVVTLIKFFDNVAWYMALFAALMVFVIGIFMLLSIFWYKYTYYTEEEGAEQQETSFANEKPPLEDDAKY